MSDPTELTLTQFLEARLAEDEAAARAATPGPWEAFRRGDPAGPFGVVAESAGDIDSDVVPDFVDGTTKDDAAHIARHDPARMLAECAAKRAIVARAGGVEVGYPSHHLAQGVLRLLALPYAGHPDFDERWRP